MNIEYKNQDNTLLESVNQLDTLVESDNQPDTLVEPDNQPDILVESDNQLYTLFESDNQLYIIIKSENDFYFSCKPNAHYDSVCEISSNVTPAIAGPLTLIRVYGFNTSLVLPDSISKINPYCFSATNKLGNLNSELIRYIPANAYEICGDRLEAIVFSDALSCIGRYAFYNCTKLKKLKIGSNNIEIESDAFMNCKKLNSVQIDCESNQESSLKALLRFITWEVEVSFNDSSIFFPGYTESYEEIAPAHIFGLSVDGEGFRARQCFNGNTFNFNQYDDIFSKACAMESEEVLCKMACNRLFYHTELTAQSEKNYHNWLEQHEKCLVDYLINLRELEKFEQLLNKNHLSDSCIDYAIISAINSGWTEGSSKLVRLKNEQLNNKTDSCGFIKKSYDF